MPSSIGGGNHVRVLHRRLLATWQRRHDLAAARRRPGTGARRKPARHFRAPPAFLACNLHPETTRDIRPRRRPRSPCRSRGRSRWTSRACRRAMRTEAPQVLRRWRAASSATRGRASSPGGGRGPRSSTTRPRLRAWRRQRHMVGTEPLVARRRRFSSREDLERSGRERGRDDAFDEGLTEDLRRLLVHRAIEGDDPAESAQGVGLTRRAIRLGETHQGDAARVGVLDDDRCAASNSA